MKTEGEAIDRHEDKRRSHRQTDMKTEGEAIDRHEDKRRSHRQT